MNACRNITRAFLIRRTVNKIAAKNDGLTVTQLYILFCFHLVGGKETFISVPKVAVIMQNADRCQNTGDMYKDCAEMFEAGYLVKSESTLIKYRISIDGWNLLMQVEKGSRLERWDR